VAAPEPHEREAHPQRRPLDAAPAGAWSGQLLEPRFPLEVAGNHTVMRRGVPHSAKPSDQMPEEAPAEQVPDDVSEAAEGAARESVRRHAKGVRGPLAQAPGGEADGKAGDERASEAGTHDRA
jgi:hypothetical protein